MSDTNPKKRKGSSASSTNAKNRHRQLPSDDAPATKKMRLQEKAPVQEKPTSSRSVSVQPVLSRTAQEKPTSSRSVPVEPVLSRTAFELTPLRIDPDRITTEFQQNATINEQLAQILANQTQHMRISYHTNEIARDLQMPNNYGLSGQIVLDYLESVRRAGPKDFISIAALQRKKPFLPWLSALNHQEIDLWIERNHKLALEGSRRATAFLRESMADLENAGFNIGFTENRTTKSFGLFGYTLDDTTDEDDATDEDGDEEVDVDEEEDDGDEEEDEEE
ncbi:hypothetical protein HDU88_001992 [Geranomyces variabilis]|nr:hypothetical protein HDU88_001992 [Geranomyces variabilis]